MDSLNQSIGTDISSPLSPEPAFASGRKRPLDKEQPAAVKKKPVSVYFPELVSKKAGYFIPDDLTVTKGIIKMPSAQVRKSINDFQICQLEVTDSSIDNQGVHLKKQASPILASQVLAIYEGCQTRTRYLTSDEKEITGCDSDPNSFKWLVWHNSGAGQPYQESRIPSFQASNRHLFYRDEKNRQVWLGVDAIDSPYPISHINHGGDDANILLLPCINPALLSPDRATDLELSCAPDAGDFCFIAVANRNIRDGEELLMDYGCDQPEVSRYFWGPEYYFHPVTAMKPLMVSFSGNGMTASIDKGKPDQLFCPNSLKFKLENLLCQKQNLAGIAAQCNEVDTNPLTGNTQWTPGCVQRLCELLNIEHLGMAYLHPSYVFHCINTEGRLDNVGKNYLTGFIRNSSLGICQPEPRLETMAEVILFLEQQVLRLLPSSHSSPELGNLFREFQWLKQLHNDSVSDTSSQPGSEIGLDRARELKESQAHEQIAHVISQVKIFHKINGRDNQEKLLRIASQRLNKHFPWSPAGMWPNIMRNSVWTPAHLRLLRTLLPPVCEDIKVGSDFDILACYHPGSPDYIAAIKRVLALEYKVSSLEVMIPKMKTMGLRGSGEREDRAYDHNRKPYLIPHLPDIPEELWGTTDWENLTLAHWQALGLERADPLVKLKQLIERFTEKGMSNNPLRFLVDHAHLWTGLTGIKSEIKEFKPQSVVLLRHLIHLSGACLNKYVLERDRWHWIDSLRVLDAETPEYREVMTEFLKHSLTKKENAYEIARELDQISSVVNPFVPEAVRNMTRVELPEWVKRRFDDRWTGEAVEALCKEYDIQPPEELVLLPDIKCELQAIVTTKLAGAHTSQKIKDRLKNLLTRNPEFCQKLARVSGLDPDKIKDRSQSSIRVLLHDLNIRDGKIPADLKLQEADKFNLTAVDSPVWGAQMMKLVDYLLGLGHSLSYVALRLQEGSNNPKEQKFHAVPVPEVYRQEQGGWNYSVLTRFMAELGVDLTTLAEQYPEAKACLELEQRLYAHQGEVSLRDGMLIDRMLSPTYSQPLESEARLTHLAEYLKNGLLNGTNAELLERFAAIKLSL